jgi:hypothetical protein
MEKEIRSDLVESSERQSKGILDLPFFVGPRCIVVPRCWIFKRIVGLISPVLRMLYIALMMILKGSESATFSLRLCISPFLLILELFRLCSLWHRWLYPAVL